MTDSFNLVYGKPDDPFYYGLKPSRELEIFLNKIKHIRQPEKP